MTTQATLEPRAGSSPAGGPLEGPTGGPAGWWRRTREAPNPVWLREMRQAARLTRTPFILMTVTSLTALLLCSIGGLMTSSGSSSISPAVTGVALHHTFFSIAYFVVTLAGAATSANSIASEREGRTWEALQLTGLPPATVARGKFLAAYTSIALYIVMLAPVGALCFLFGGVTPLEVAAAFGCLFVLAGLSVAFGLAISSRTDNLRAALVTTIFATLVLAPILFVIFGPAATDLAHDLWPQVPEGPPIWLPTALERAPFGLTYVALLIVAPLLLLGLPAWFLYAVTSANLTPVTDDRSSGVRVWFVTTTALLSTAATAAILSANSASIDQAAIAVTWGLVGLSVFQAFVHAGEPVGPSRRVLMHWQQTGAGALRRSLGPGVMRAAWAQIVVGLCATLAVSVVALLALALSPGTHATEAAAVCFSSLYAACFTVFLVGLGAYGRVRLGAPGPARMLLLVMLFVVGLGPWIFATIIGAVGRGGDEGLLVAAPSPFFAIALAERMRRSTSVTELQMGCGAASLLWGLIGTALVALTSSRCRAIIDEHERAVAESDAFLAAEDGAALAAATDASPRAEGRTPPHDEAAPSPVAAEATPFDPVAANAANAPLAPGIGTGTDDHAPGDGSQGDGSGGGRWTPAG